MNRVLMKILIKSHYVVQIASIHVTLSLSIKCIQTLKNKLVKTSNESVERNDI